MEAQARARFQRYGSRKVAQLLREIRGKSVLEAEEILPSVPRACREMVEKTVKSAAANLAIKLGRAGKTVVPERVFIKSCWAGAGPMGHMKRVLPAPQGRAMTFKRKVSHLTVIVSDGVEENN
ncbi:MAG TPA: uL22 family ribosomal protein [Elusimicrobiota bacterium]|nr:uL22 family ribosomal protein [Elusimicrobiota bacterium]